MNNLNQYIIEKLHLNKDIKISNEINKVETIDYVTNVIYDTLKNDFNLTKNDFKIYSVTQENFIANTPQEAIAISLYLKKENSRNKKLHEDIKDKLSKELYEYDVNLEKNTIRSGAYKIKIYFDKNISMT